jgi:hypothetical protein
MTLSTSERRSVSEIGKAVGGLILSLIVIGAIVFGGWRVGWWFKEQNVERQAHVFRQSYANQERLREDLTEKIGTVLTIEAQIAELEPRTEGEDIAKLQAQARGVLDIACHDASQISGDELSLEQSSYIAANCQLGNAAP